MTKRQKRNEIFLGGFLIALGILVTAVLIRVSIVGTHASADNVLGAKITAITLLAIGVLLIVWAALSKADKVWCEGCKTYINEETMGIKFNDSNGLCRDCLNRYSIVKGREAK